MVSPFHSSVESGLRALIVLLESYPKSYDLDRLHHYDHIIVHSKDFGGEKSLHAEIPSRSNELLVRRNIVEDGVRLLRRKGLVEQVLDPKEGILFKASDGAYSYIETLESEYIAKLRCCARWMLSQYGDLNAQELKRIVSVEEYHVIDNKFNFVMED